MKKQPSNLRILLLGILLFSPLGIQANIRFQGRLVDSAGTPLAGNLYVRHAADMSPYYYGGPYTLSHGDFDFTFNESGNTSVALVFSPTGVTPGSTESSYREDQLVAIHLSGPYWILNGDFSDQFPMPAGNAFCALNLRAKVHYDGARSIYVTETQPNVIPGWCPDSAASKLGTQISQSFPSGNLVSNGSFEANPQPADSQPYEKWDVSGIYAGANFAPIYQPLGNLRPHSGKKVAAINFTSPPSGAQETARLRSAFFPVKANTEYAVSFYYSAKDPVNWAGTDSVRLMVKTFTSLTGSEVYDVIASNGRFGKEAYQVSANTWRRYFHRFKTGANAAFAGLEMLRTNSYNTGGTFYFDDITVTESSALLNGAGMDSSESQQAYRTGNTTTFVDALNQPIQTRTELGGTVLVTQTIYDGQGRAAQATLPIAQASSEGDTNGYVSGVPAKAHDDYDGGAYPNAGGFVLSQTRTDHSPLGRQVESSAPGSPWSFGNHTVKQYYSSTTDTISSYDRPSPASPGSAKYAYHFFEGPDGEMNREFTDNLGRVVRKSSKAGGSWVNTEYVYDANGNVTHIIPPAGSGGSRQVTHRTYSADGKKLSDSTGDYGKVRYIYDAGGLLRFSQSQAQRNDSRFTYFKYDALEREVEAGEYLDDEDFTQATALNPDFPTRSHPYRRVRIQNYYDVIPEEAPDCFEEGGEGIFMIRAGTTDPYQYTSFNAAYAAATTLLSGMTSYGPGSVRFVQVYSDPGEVVTPSVDEYEAIPLASGHGSVRFTLTAMPLYQYLSLLNAHRIEFPSGISWGPLKGRLTKTVTCNEALRNTVAGLKPLVKLFNYDKYGNTSAVYEYNGYLDDEERWRKSTMRYDVQNRVVEKTRYNDLATDTLPEATLRYSYDVAGRVDTVRNGNDQKVLINVYNELGQLIQQYPNPDDGIRIEYAYHLRGWPISIGAYNSADEALFSQSLHYEDGVNPTYNGHVSEYFSLMEGDISSYGYYFVYDDLNRLVHAETERNSGGSDGEWDFAYHANGSIDEMVRHGQTFDYVYNAGKNQLDKVTHTGSTPPRNASATDNFQYDADGRMISDASKRLTVTHDDALDRPYKFLVKDGSGNPVKAYYMVYDEAGSRVSKLEYATDATWATSKHYFDSGEEYRELAGGSDPVPVYAMDGFGRVAREGGDGPWTLETYLKNHLGSTVMVYHEGDEVYRTDYEPYGKLRGETETSDVPLTQKFTGKELDAGIDLTYFGARYYDDDFGVWISPDAARQHHSLYTYGSNNPINRVDPDGKQDEDASMMGLYTGVVAGQPSPGDAQFSKISNAWVGSWLGASFLGVSIVSGGVLGPQVAVGAGRAGVAAYRYAATTGVPSAAEMASAATRIVNTYWPEIGLGLFGAGVIAERAGVHGPISSGFQAAGEIDFGPASPAIQFGGSMFELGGAASSGFDANCIDRP